MTEVPSGTGGVAQLGERLLCKQEVIGSIPFTSTILLRVERGERIWRAFVETRHEVPLSAASGALRSRRGFVD